MEQQTKGSAAGAGKLSSEEFDRLQTPNDSLEPEVKTLLATIAGLEDSRIEAEKQIETLRRALFQLSDRVAGFRHFPPNVRVLDFGEHPDRTEVDVGRARLYSMGYRCPFLTSSNGWL